MTNPPIYMISIEGDETSQYYRSICENTWVDMGYSLSHYNAITPATIPNYDFDLKFQKNKHSGVPFTPTEIAIWYSHFDLWKKCIDLNSPICIIEHDAYLLEPLPSFEDRDFHYFSSTKKRKFSLSPCSGYYITPLFSRGLVEAAEKELHTFNVDGYLYRYSKFYYGPMYVGKFNARKESRNYPTSCFQYLDPNIGTTIEHLKKHTGSDPK